MDFITYLKRVINSFKSIGSEEEDKKTAQAAGEELEKYINEYKSEPIEQTYERLDSDVMTDAQIEEKAKAEYDTWLKNKSDTLIADYDIKQSSQAAKKSGLSDDYDNLSAQIEKEFDGLKQDQRHSSVKRGVARSSISQNEKTAVDDAKQQSKDDAQQKYLSDLAKIDENISVLENKRKAALDDLDYDYAKLIDQRVTKLKRERQERLDEVHKYENELRKIEKQEQKPKIDEKTSEDIYKKADEMLGKMSPYEASAYMKDNVKLKNSLSAYYYYKLYKKYA